MAATNEHRRALWHKLICFLAWTILSRKFSYLYVAGGYCSDRDDPHDVDVVLETLEPYGPSSLRALEPYFAVGLETISTVFSIHLHFWMEDAPPGMTDFRTFFQQDRSPDLDQPDAGRRLLRVSLQGAEIKEDLKHEISLTGSGWLPKDAPVK